MMVKIQRTAWIIFVLFGLSVVLPGYQSLCLLCIEPQHWDWLTRDPNILDYLNETWRLIGIHQLAFGLLTLIIAATSYRKGVIWAWFAMWIWPAYIIGIGFVAPYLWPALIVYMLLAIIGLFLPYRLFFPQENG